jgi:hypothetical protein
MGLKEGDLVDLVYRVIEIDSYKSKMGSDQDIVVISFTVNEEQPAKDLSDFIEKGYSFVLDADVSPGELDDGMYRVFVEIERDKHVPEQVMELMDGIKKLTNNKNWKFRYYKGFRSQPLTVENLAAEIPLDTDSYNQTVTESNMNNFKNFFNKSYLDSIELTEDEELIIKKVFADPIGFKIKDFGNTTHINENIKEKININDYAEILFLTKYIGDYNVTKYGKTILTFENAGHTLVLERI